MKSTLIRGGLIVTMNPRREVFVGDLRLREGVISDVGRKLRVQGREEVINASGCFVIPGLIQAHVHLCQTLFRGLADDLQLLDWLEQKIWPMEAAHTPRSLRRSAQLGLLEMQLGGTTSILDMGTVHLHEVVFAEVLASGMRYWGGNCLMDLRATSGPLYRPFAETLEYCKRLIAAWHLRTPRIQYAISPRFAISCSDRMLRAAVVLQKRHGLLLHTHAAENRREVALVKKRTGLANVHFLKRLDLLNSSTVIAHVIHLARGEVRDMVRAEAGLTHCPSSNLKLASGVAPITSYLAAGLKVALGADGAACSNGLDPFVEMRLAALLQKPLFGPTALPAQQAFELATLGGARVLNASAAIGSLEAGKRADVVVVRRDRAAVATVRDPYSALVYSCTGQDVRDVWIDGTPIVRASQHLLYDQPSLVRAAKRELDLLLKRTVKRTVKCSLGRRVPNSEPGTFLD